MIDQSKFALLLVIIPSVLVSACKSAGMPGKVSDDYLTRQVLLASEVSNRKQQEQVHTAKIIKDSANLPRWTNKRPPLSPGDRVQVNVNNGKTFTGLYEVDIDGALNIPYLPPQNVAGMGTKQAEKMITNALVKAKQFHASRIWVSVRVQQWAAVQVHVSGAVFNTGLVTVNVRNAEERAQKSTQDSGDFPHDRLLQAALRAAGGVRPDAAIERILLVRNGKTSVVDFSGLPDGMPITPVPLMTGDTIMVPSSGQLNNKLLSPSVITTPGIRVYLSNLTAPAPGNAAAAISKNVTSLPYGSRMLTALMSANCIGGAGFTNAGRHALLVRNNPINGRQEVEKRSIEQLIENPERSDINVHLMPNDSVACYDSGVTNMRDIARTIFDIIVPFTLF